MSDTLEFFMATPPLTIDHDPAMPDVFVVRGATQAHQIGLLSIPGCRFASKGDRYWTIPARYAQVVALGRQYALEWTLDAVEAFTPIAATVEACQRLRNDGLSADEERVVTEMLAAHDVHPKQGQAAAIVQLVTAGGAALFSEMGSGKSLVVAGALRLYELAPALIVCPPSVLYNWRRELERFGIHSTVIDGTLAQKRKIMESLDLSATPVVIVSYGTAKKLTRLARYGSTALKRCNPCGGHHDLPEDKCEVHERFLNTIDWQVVVVDEAHRIRDPHTIVTRAVWHLTSSVPYRWFLTGTPIESNAKEFWSILHAIDADEHPSSSKYMDRYLLMNQTFWGEKEVLGLNPVTKAEFEEVTQWRWRRDIKVGMPEVAYETRTTALSPKAAKAYRTMERQLMAEVGMEGSDDTTVLLADNHMVKYTRLLQLANATCEITADGEVMMSEPSDKLDLFIDTLEDIGEPAIAWFSSVRMLKLASQRLEKLGIAHVTLHGETPPKRRQEAVDAFQRGDVDLILLNPAAGGEGITLTRARVSIWVMRPASSIQNSQADDRNNRYGVQHDELLCIDLVAEGTIEEQALERLFTKRAALQEVVG
jgi:SNF2 family DNA or RNA helicase